MATITTTKQEENERKNEENRENDRK